MQEATLAQMMQAATPRRGTSIKAEQTDELELDKASEANLAVLQTQYTDEYPEVKAAKRRVADLKGADRQGCFHSCRSGRPQRRLMWTRSP